MRLLKKDAPTSATFKSESAGQCGDVADVNGQQDHTFDAVDAAHTAAPAHADDKQRQAQRRDDR